MQISEDVQGHFLKIAYKGLELQKRDGSFKPGYNGPYKDPETPIRNTAHWMVSFINALKLTKDEKFELAIRKGFEYLKKPEWRPVGGTFHCRNKEGKDHCNGLVGQAWLIESLMLGYELLNDQELLQISEDVFLQHEYSTSRKIWYRKESDGKKLDFDFTFNHQLWFCYAGFLIAEHSKNESIRISCETFFQYINQNLLLAGNGRIRQSIRRGFVEDSVKPFAKLFLRRGDVAYMRLKEIGYHAFNTIAFSTIRRIRPDLPFFDTKTYRRILLYLTGNEYDSLIEKSKYGFEYNPPGIESYVTFKLNSELEQHRVYFEKWLNRNFDKNFNPSDSMLNANVHDPETGAARIYELSQCL